MFYGHISGIDTLAHGLLIAAKMIDDGKLQKVIKERYSGWQSELGQQLLKRHYNVAEISQYALNNHLNPQPISGHQELLEHWMNNYL